MGLIRRICVEGACGRPSGAEGEFEDGKEGTLEGRLDWEASF